MPRSVDSVTSEGSITTRSRARTRAESPALSVDSEDSKLTTNVSPINLRRSTRNSILGRRSAEPEVGVMSSPLRRSRRLSVQSDDGLSDTGSKKKTNDKENTRRKSVRVDDKAVGSPKPMTRRMSRSLSPESFEVTKRVKTRNVLSTLEEIKEDSPRTNRRGSDSEKMVVVLTKSNKRADETDSKQESDDSTKPSEESPKQTRRYETRSCETVSDESGQNSEKNIPLKKRISANSDNLQSGHDTIGTDEVSKQQSPKLANEINSISKVKNVSPVVVLSRTSVSVTPVKQLNLSCSESGDKSMSESIKKDVSVCNDADEKISLTKDPEKGLNSNIEDDNRELVKIVDSKLDSNSQLVEQITVEESEYNTFMSSRNTLTPDKVLRINGNNEIDKVEEESPTDKSKKSVGESKNNSDSETVDQDFSIVITEEETSDVTASHRSAALENEKDVDSESDSSSQRVDSIVMDKLEFQSDTPVSVKEDSCDDVMLENDNNERESVAVEESSVCESIDSATGSKTENVPEDEIEIVYDRSEIEVNSIQERGDVEEGEKEIEILNESRVSKNGGVGTDETNETEAADEEMECISLSSNTDERVSVNREEAEDDKNMKRDSIVVEGICDSTCNKTFTVIIENEIHTSDSENNTAISAKVEGKKELEINKEATEYQNQSTEDSNDSKEIGKPEKVSCKKYDSSEESGDAETEEITTVAEKPDSSKLFNEESPSSTKYNDDSSTTDFLDDEAMECEGSDTPSDGSNDIIEKGESLGESDSDENSSDSYVADDFIVDDCIDDDALLSGTGDDLSDASSSDNSDGVLSQSREAKRKYNETKRKRSKIIALSSSSDEDDRKVQSMFEDVLKEVNEKNPQIERLEQQNDTESLIVNVDDTPEIEVSDSEIVTCSEPIICDSEKVVVDSVNVFTVSDNEQNVNISEVNSTEKKRKKRNSSVSKIDPEENNLCKSSEDRSRETGSNNYKLKGKKRRLSLAIVNDTPLLSNSSAEEKMNADADLDAPETIDENLNCKFTVSSQFEEESLLNQSKEKLKYTDETTKSDKKKRSSRGTATDIMLYLNNSVESDVTADKLVIVSQSEEESIQIKSKQTDEPPESENDNSAEDKATTDDDLEVFKATYGKLKNKFEIILQSDEEPSQKKSKETVKTPESSQKKKKRSPKENATETPSTAYDSDDGDMNAEDDKNTLEASYKNFMSNCVAISQFDKKSPQKKSEETAKTSESDKKKMKKRKRKIETNSNSSDDDSTKRKLPKKSRSHVGVIREASVHDDSSDGVEGFYEFGSGSDEYVPEIPTVLKKMKKCNMVAIRENLKKPNVSEKKSKRRRKRNKTKKTKDESENYDLFKPSTSSFVQVQKFNDPVIKKKTLERLPDNILSVLDQRPSKKNTDKDGGKKKAKKRLSEEDDARDAKRKKVSGPKVKKVSGFTVVPLRCFTAAPSTKGWTSFKNEMIGAGARREPTEALIAKQTKCRASKSK